MYTWEIEELIRYKNYLLSVDEYLKILNTSPQIRECKYNPGDDTFEIWTEEGSYICFKVSSYLEKEKQRGRT